MPYFYSRVDNALLHYIDYRPASSPPPFQPTADPSKDLSKSNVTLVFIHGWPMSSAMWSHLTLRLCEGHHIRCVASDRRGFGKSEWTGSRLSKSESITYDSLARDTLACVEHLDFGDEESFVFVAASMGCGETLLAYQMMSQTFRKKCKGFLWMGPSMPFPLRTEEHPEGPPRELWDAILSGFRNDRVGFVKAAIPGVFGIGPQFTTGIELPESVLARFEAMAGQADAVAIERCVMMITSRDFTEELKVLGEEVKVLVLHGDQDQGMSPYCCRLNPDVPIFCRGRMFMQHADLTLSQECQHRCLPTSSANM